MMKQKIKQLQQILQKKKIDLALFLDYGLQKRDPNLAYFTGGVRLEYCCLAIHKKQSPFLLVPGFEYERAKKLLKGKLKVIKPKIKKKFWQEIKKQLKGKRIRKIGITGTILSYKELRAMRKIFRKISVKDIGKDMLAIRSVKTTEEIGTIRKSCAIASRILENCFRNFKKFKTEQDVVRFLKEKTPGNNCGLAFEPIVATGNNAYFPHHCPEKKRLKSGFGLIDFGIKHKGYCSDITRTFYIGKPTKEELNLYNFILNTQENAIKGLRAGKSLGKLTRNVQHILGKNFPHGLGHGIGIEIHEFPNLKPDSGDKAENKMIFTVEPGYYVKGRLGIRIEDSVLISRGKPVILTKISKKLRIFSRK